MRRFSTFRDFDWMLLSLVVLMSVISVLEIKSATLQTKFRGFDHKQIEFLLQEVNREINTMGAKSQSAALSRITVGLKGEVEKMREQVQNVE